MQVSEKSAVIAGKPSSYFSNVRREMLPFVPADASVILDVGCGEGWFARELRLSRGANVWGIEPVAEVAEKARANLDKVFCGTADSVLPKLPRNHFDCVVFNDVLEHLVDPWAVLHAAKAVVAPQGTVVASIPNIRYFRSLYNFVVRKQWHYEDDGIMDRTHLRFFTRNSIEELFTSSGYRIRIVQGINPTPSWRVAFLNRLSLGFFADTTYMQFACVAEPASDCT